MILFQSEFITTMSVTFCRTDHSKKRLDNVTDQALVTTISRNRSHQSFRVSPLIITIEYVTLTLTVIFCSTANNSAFLFLARKLTFRPISGTMLIIRIASIFARFHHIGFHYASWILQGFPRLIGWFPYIFGWFPYFFGAFPRFLAVSQIWSLVFCSLSNLRRKQK